MDRLRQHLSVLLSTPSVATDQIFDLLWQKLEDDYASRKNVTISDLKAEKAINKEKGTLFELLCTELIRQKALLKSYKVKEVYKFADLTNELRVSLGITTASGKPTKKDMGIDIFALCDNGEWLAIQCKYIKKPYKQRYTPNGYKVQWVVPCASLSSFYDICGRTGPREKNNSWLRNVVMTNCMGVRRRAKKGEKDLSICHGQFSALDRDVWTSLCGYKAHTLNSDNILGNSKGIRNSDIKGETIHEKGEESKNVNEKNETVKTMCKKDKTTNTNTEQDKSLIEKNLKTSDIPLSSARNAFLDRLISNSSVKV